MSRQKLEAIKKELMQRKRDLEEKLTQLSKEKLTEDEVLDPGDQALTSTLETLRISWQDAELDEYKRIIRALEKMEDGSYGTCVDCNEPISEKRLKSYPNAARCLSCQEAFEEK